MRDLINIVEKSLLPGTDTPEFQNWFKGSWVVDKQGKPIVCYHGTFEDFAEFSYSPKNRTSYGFNRLGFWFDTDPRTPAWLAGYEEDGRYPNVGSIYPCYLSIKKPFYLDSEYLFGEDQEHMRELAARVKEYGKLFHSAKRDQYGNARGPDGQPIRLPDGSIFTDRHYQNATKEYDNFVEKLGNNQHRIDGFWKLMELLPDGIKSKTEDVVKFQQELISEGYDGIFLGDTIADFSSRNYETTHWWIAFHPNQIKSIFAKEFNPESGNISEAR